MNKLTEFRGKTTDTNEWVYGNLLKIKTDPLWNNTGFMWFIIPNLTNGSWSKNKLILNFISPCFEVIPETVGQYIGIEDKNGVKTFSNDKIRIGGIEAEIIFRDGAFRAKSESGEYAFDDIFSFEVKQ